MRIDAQGNTLSGATAEAAEIYDEAVEAFNIYRGDPVGLLDQAIEAAPGFAMASRPTCSALRPSRPRHGMPGRSSPR